MLTQLIRKLLRILSVALAGTVAAVLAGPALAANAAAYFARPVRPVAAVKPLPEKQYADSVVEPVAPTTSSVPFVTTTPTTSSITITPVVEATMTPGVTPTAAAADSAPVPTLPDSPTAVATTDTPEPSHTVAPVKTPAPVKTTTKPAPVKTTAKPAPVKPKPSAPVASVVRAAKVLSVLSFARLQLGERYVMGGMGPNTWDCSGLTKAAFSHVGINIGTHSSNNQYQTAKAKGYLVPFSQKKAGDLVFYGTPGDIYHVAIYSGNGKIIEAANPARPVIERPYWGTPYSYVARFIR